MEIHEIMFLLRRRKGLTQVELRKIAGISQCHMSDLENGKKKFSVAQFENFSKALGIPSFVISFFAYHGNDLNGDTKMKIQEILEAEFPIIKNL